MTSKQQEQFTELQAKNMDAAMKLAQLSIENSPPGVGLRLLPVISLL
mgnify:CR=1 FL=1